MWRDWRYGPKGLNPAGLNWEARPQIWNAILDKILGVFIWLISLFEDRPPWFSEERSYCTSLNAGSKRQMPRKLQQSQQHSLHPAARLKVSVNFQLFAFQDHKEASQFPKSQQVTTQKLTTGHFHWQFLYCLNTAQSRANRVRDKTLLFSSLFLISISLQSSTRMRMIWFIEITQMQVSLPWNVAASCKDSQLKICLWSPIVCTIKWSRLRLD